MGNAHAKKYKYIREALLIGEMINMYMRTNAKDDFKVNWAKAGIEVMRNMRIRTEMAGGRVYTTIQEDANFGAEAWKYTYRLTENDDEAIKLLAEYLFNQGDDVGLAFGSPDFQVYATWAIKWAHFAFPQIVLGSKITAAFMASCANDEIKQQLKPPWDAFLIRIPNDLLYTTDQNGKKIELDRIEVVRTYSTEQNRWKWHWMAGSTKSNVNIWQIGMKPEYLDHDANEVFSSEDCTELFGTVDDLDTKVSRLVGRIIIGVCLSFPEHNKAIGKCKNIKPPKSGYIQCKGAPLIRNYEIRAPIQIDCRQTIRNYLESGTRTAKNGSGPKVQFMVRGHYRLPPGGGNGQKTVWVRPYWKGPEEAKVIVRGHTVKE